MFLCTLRDQMFDKEGKEYKAMEGFCHLADILRSEKLEVTASGTLSGRQEETAGSAVLAAMNREFQLAFADTIDFMHNYDNNTHNLTFAEFTVLVTILTFVGVSVDGIKMTLV